MNKKQSAFQQFALDLIIKENERLKQENQRLRKQLQELRSDSAAKHNITHEE